MSHQTNSTYFFWVLLLSPWLFASCIGDDIIDDEVDPILRITNPIDTIAFDSSYQFNLMYLNNIGREEAISNVSWTSSNPDIISISASGLAKGIASGQSFLKASVFLDSVEVYDEVLVEVGEETVTTPSERTGTLRTTTFYELEGSFSLAEVEDELVLSFGEDYVTSDRLPGLYLYLTNNPNTTSGAFEIGEVTIFEGEHSYTLPSDVGINDYEYVLYFCKPFNVKVGDGQFDN